MAQTTDNIALAQKGYDAFARADMTTLAELLAPDVQWFVGGDNALTGTYSGRDATFDYLGRLLGLTQGTASVQVHTLAEPMPGIVVAMVRLHAEVNGKTFDEDAIQQLEIRDGQCVSCRTFLQNGHLLDSVLGPAIITLTEQGRVAAR